MLADLTRIIPDRTLSLADISASAAALLDPATDDELKANFLRAWGPTR